MKKISRNSSLLLLASLAFFVYSCSKESPQPSPPTTTTTTTATTGSVVFWIASDLGCGNITVSLNGVSATISSINSAGAPACGSSGSASFTLAAGIYNYSASCTSLSWTGTVTVTVGGCANLPLTGKSPATTTAPNTFFLSNECYTVNNLGDWWAQSFTITATTNFVLRFASQYKADAAIVDESQINNFKNNQPFTGYAGFDDQFGYKYVTLNAGTYYLAIRNQISSANILAVELDYYIILPSTDQVTYNDDYVSGGQSLNSGAKLWQPFTIQNGFRYFIDGNNK